MRAKTILDYIEMSAAKNVDGIAVIDTEKRYTYGELISLAKRIGTAIEFKMGICKSPVVVFMDKGADCLATMLGTLYSGRAYVPMDVRTPIERLNLILDSVGAKGVITTERDKHFLERIGYNGESILLEDMLEEFLVGDNELLAGIRSRMIDTSLMYVLFTSGSTGIPKGVAILHRSVIDYVDAVSAAIEMGPEDVVGNQTPFYADMSVKDIYVTLYTGGSILIIPQKYFMSPKLLLEYLQENRVSTLYWVPTAYGIVQRFDALSEVKPESIKKLMFAGESMPIHIFNYWKKAYPEAMFVQLYGPTEITDTCVYYIVNREFEEGDRIPIGKPFENSGVILLDENEKMVTEAGIEGEICVYGSCLAAGYYNNPEKTKEVFVQNPLVKGYESLMYKTGDVARWDDDGNLVFVSRKDYQVKHGGRRIELGEIEVAAQAVDGVMACCCAQNRLEDALILYYVGDVEPKGIMIELRNKLPQYMVPAECRRLDSMPLLSNGKTDRKTIDAWANA